MANREKVTHHGVEGWLVQKPMRFFMSEPKFELMSSFVLPTQQRVATACLQNI